MRKASAGVIAGIEGTPERRPYSAASVRGAAVERSGCTRRGDGSESCDDRSHAQILAGCRGRGVRGPHRERRSPGGLVCTDLIGETEAGVDERLIGVCRLEDGPTGPVSKGTWVAELQ